MAQRDKVRLALTARDHVVDETAEARQKNSGSSPDGWDGVAWGSVELFPFDRTDAPNGQPFLLGSACTVSRTKTFRELRFILQMHVRCTLDTEQPVIRLAANPVAMIQVAAKLLRANASPAESGADRCRR